MSIKQRCRLGAMALAAALALSGGCAAAADSDQTIYLDPQTGKVIQHPAPEAPSAQSSQRATTANSDSAGQQSDGYTRWQTSDGTQMLSVDPNQTPKERVVRCADGSLRMGSAGDDSSDDNDPEALCGQSAD